MPEEYRSTIDDAFIDGMDCAICTAPALRVNHLSEFTDYISCDECGSSFVVEEDGDRVLYGKVAKNYTDTEKVVLKNWMSLVVVARLANSERLRREIGTPWLPEEEPAEEIEPETGDDPTPSQESPEAGFPTETTDAEIPDIPEEMTPADVEFRLEDRLGLVDDKPVEEPEMEVDVLDALEVPEAVASDRIEAALGGSPEPSIDVPIVLPAREEPVVEAAAGALAEPVPSEQIQEDQPAEKVEEGPPAPPEKFYRVRIEGESVYFPMKACVHCMKTPADHKTSVIGSLPTGRIVGQRRRAVFSVPICPECRQKFSAKSEAQKNARLQAHLTSLIIGLVLVIAAIALDVIDMSRNAAVGLLLVAIITGVGYLLPVGFLLQRAERFPAPHETHLVRTTLTVRPPDEPIAESYFDFRNGEYAQLFRDSNPATVMSEVEEILIQMESKS